MLKSLLLSGWFRIQPFFKYIIVLILIAPLVGVSIHSSVAKQSQIKTGKITTGLGKSDTNSPGKAIVRGKGLNTAVNKPVSEKKEALQADIISAGVGEQKNQQTVNVSGISDIMVVFKQGNVADISVSVNQADLIQKLKDAKNQALGDEVNSVSNDSLGHELLTTATNRFNNRGTQPPIINEIPVDKEQNQFDAVPEDPMNSPHPIPWKWIMKTQEAIANQGGSRVRHYRSIPVVSPDGRYAVYSRVELEVQPEMHDSRVSSLLFLEDRQTKKLQVMAKTAPVSDPLLQQTVTAKETDQQGKIGVLVPVSWSEKGDRFLARKFVGIFNTADVTDHAVIWHRQENHTKTVAPAQSEDDHEKIAILLGWSKQQPDHVLFRAGELGEENWPLVQVSSDGKTVNVTNDGDQAVTFGEIDRQVWAKPKVASR